MFSKMMINRSEQRVIVTKLLSTLMRLGFDKRDMRDAFPNYDNIDPFIYKFSKTLDTEKNFH